MDQLQQYQWQVAKLATELKCRLYQSPNMIPMMYVEFGYVEGPTIESQIDYLACLHELGHFALGHTQGRPPKESERFYFTNGVLRSEAQAWEFALNLCLDEPTPESRKTMEWALKTYWDACLKADGYPTRIHDPGDRHHVRFVYDLPDRYFMAVLDRIRGGT
jgi:hypothetical protein